MAELRRVLTIASASTDESVALLKVVRGPTRGSDLAIPSIRDQGEHMKLGEALTRRGDLQTRVSELRNRLTQSARVQEGEKPHEDPVALLSEFESVADDLEKLVAHINRTNLVVQLPDGRTLTEALARRDSLTLRHTTLRALAEAAAEKHDRYSRSEIRVLSTVAVAEIRQRADDLARERRELDVAIQEANWASDLIED